MKYKMRQFASLTKLKRRDIFALQNYSKILCKHNKYVEFSFIKIVYGQFYN
jgi:hypothetical protein